MGVGKLADIKDTDFLKLGGAAYPVSPSPQRLAAGGADLERIVAKHHQRAAWRHGKRDEADLYGAGHEKILQNQGCRQGGMPLEAFECTPPGARWTSARAPANYDPSPAALPSAHSGRAAT